MNQVTKLAQRISESRAFKARLLGAQTSVTKRRLSFYTEALSNTTVEKLILQASVLALSEDVIHKSLAQKINALLLEENPEDVRVNYAIQVLSSRLGNFPVIRKGSTVFGAESLFEMIDQDNNVSNLFDPEVIGSLYTEEEESRSEINSVAFHFNLYQREILEALRSKSLISFSAPTSFGKSFIVRHHIVRLFSTSEISRALIIVPTKSLIDDFYESLVNLKNDLNITFSIHTHVRSVESVSEKSIFILTQERLSFLVQKNPEFVREFEVVYCDEAQSISRGYRGFVLRSVLKKVIAICGIRGLNGGTQYIFSSPLIKNPQYYRQKLFSDVPEQECFHKEIVYSPVEKNIHFVVKNSREFSYKIFRDAEEGDKFKDRFIEVGSKPFGDLPELNAEIGSDSLNYEIERDTQIVKASNLGSQTILYATSPIKAHEYALSLSRLMDEGVSFNDEDLADLRKYIRDHYDECFGLIELIRKGIGLHYGKMPVSLRRAIVDYFDKGDIKYIVCTSTLLEGVNLPAKNIFVFSNKHNGNNKHSPLEFRNLIGRAGRITYGLSGNVFCVEKKIDKYKELFENVDSIIQDPEEEVSKNDTKLSHIVRSFFEPNFEYFQSPYRGDVEYVIYEMLTSDNYSNIVNGFPLSSADRERLLGLVVVARANLKLPLESLKRNPGIDPRIQDTLFESLSELAQTDLEHFLEIAANPLGITKVKILEILNYTATYLKWPRVSSFFDPLDSLASRITQWLHEASLSELIQQVLQHHQGESQLKRVDAALKVVDKLDTEISFNAPKFIKCFYDIAIECAHSHDIPNVISHEERIEAFLFAIESGISSGIGRFLFEKGVSRPLAIKVNSLFRDWSGSQVSAEFFRRADVIQQLRSGLSKIAFKELASHLEN